MSLESSSKRARTAPRKRSLAEFPLELVKYIAKFLWFDEIHTRFAPACKAFREVAKAHPLSTELRSLRDARAFVVTYFRLVLNQPIRQWVFYMRIHNMRSFKSRRDYGGDELLCAAIVSSATNISLSEQCGYLQYAVGANDVPRQSEVTRVHKFVGDFVDALCNDWVYTEHPAGDSVVYSKSRIPLDRRQTRAKGFLTFTEWRTLLVVITRNNLRQQGTLTITCFMSEDYYPDDDKTNPLISIRIWHAARDRVMRVLPLRVKPV